MIYFLSHFSKILRTRADELFECVWPFCDRTKLCGNCAFPQNVHTMKLGEIRYFTQCYVKVEDTS